MIKLLDRVVLDLHKFITNKSFKYKINNNLKKYINSVLDGEVQEPNILDLKIEELN